MRRIFRMRQAQERPAGLEGLDDAALAAMARELGVAGVPERMKRETLIRKIQELT